MRLSKFLPLLIICTSLAVSPVVAASPPEKLVLQQPANSDRLIVSDHRGLRSPAIGRIVAPAASATAPLALEVEPVDGGPGYYGRFAHALPTDPSYFPIGAWFRSAEAHQIPVYRDFGMNLFVGVENPELVDEAAIRRAGMRTLVLLSERTRFDDLGSEVAGWLVGDEIDMLVGPGDPATRTGAGYDVMRQLSAGAPDDGRARYSNYGKGVGWWETDAEAEVFVNDFQQLVSLDAYWFTDPNERESVIGGEARYGRASSYGWTVDRTRFLDGLDGQRKPIWNFVETGWPFTETAEQGGRRILPAEARAAVWHSIIAGARGILYFDHQFNGSCTESVIRGECYIDTRAALKATNEQITQLAPVLNSASVTSGWSTSASIRALVKWDGAHFYVFAGSRDGVASTGTWSLPCVGDATAVRLGEPGSVAVNSGSFNDEFANGNAIHIYRIDEASKCGLPPAAAGGGLPPAAAGGGSGTSEAANGAAGRARVDRLRKRVSLRSGRLKIRLLCTAACAVRSRLTTRVNARHVLLASSRREFSAGRHQLVLRLSRRDRRRVAGGRPMRLRTVIVQLGARVQLTQRLVTRRR